MKNIIKKIGFEENKKCRCCDLMAWYQLASTYLCERHMKGFIEFHDNMVKFQEQNK